MGVGRGKLVVMPPKSRGRDSFAPTFLNVDFISPAVTSRVIPRPGVVHLIGEPCRAGVVPRETAMLLAALTNDASLEARKTNSLEVETYTDEIVFACYSLEVRVARMHTQVEKKTTGKDLNDDGTRTTQCKWNN